MTKVNVPELVASSIEMYYSAERALCSSVHTLLRCAEVGDPLAKEFMKTLTPEQVKAAEDYYYKHIFPGIEEQAKAKPHEQ